VNRPPRSTARRERTGMKRSTRMSIIAGVAVFLSLTSGVSFAAWTASSVKTATATAGNIALTTATTGGAATITALGPYTYSAGNLTVTKPITVRNTGNVVATLSSITITSTSSTTTAPLAAAIATKFWVGTSSACAASSTSVSSTLSSATVSLTGLNMNLPAAGSAILCASTTFSGSLAAYAGKSVTSEFVLKSSAGTQWTATDVLPTASRSFTQSIQSVPQLAAPSNMSCSTSTTWGLWPQANVSWNAPTTPSGTSITYKLYYQSGSTTSLLGTTTNTAVTITDSLVTSSGTLTVVATATGFTDSTSSGPISLTYVSGFFGGVRCG